MSRSDKGVAVFARKRWHGIYAVTEGADISNTANPSFTVVGETLAVSRGAGTQYLIYNSFFTVGHTDLPLQS